MRVSIGAPERSIELKYCVRSPDPPDPPAGVKIDDGAARGPGSIEVGPTGSVPGAYSTSTSDGARSRTPSRSETS